MICSETRAGTIEERRTAFVEGHHQSESIVEAKYPRKMKARYLYDPTLDVEDYPGAKPTCVQETFTLTAKSLSFQCAELKPSYSFRDVVTFNLSVTRQLLRGDT